MLLIGFTVNSWKSPTVMHKPNTRNFAQYLFFRYKFLEFFSHFVVMLNLKFNDKDLPIFLDNNYIPFSYELNGSMTTGPTWSDV